MALLPCLADSVTDRSQADAGRRFRIRSTMVRCVDSLVGAAGSMFSHGAAEVPGTSKRHSAFQTLGGTVVPVQDRVQHRSRCPRVAYHSVPFALGMTSVRSVIPPSTRS